MILLDSLHTHAHVKNELELYSQLVSKNSYIIVFDTIPYFFDKKAQNEKKLTVESKNADLFRVQESNQAT